MDRGRVSKQIRAGLIEHARRMRSEPTPAEARLWKKLRKRQLNGLKFRRQHIVQSYIVDFYCPAAGLVIEIDGPIHEKQKDYDKNRDNYIEAAGYHVLRFTNSEVEESLKAAINTISGMCKRRIGDE